MTAPLRIAPPATTAIDSLINTDTEADMIGALLNANEGVDAVAGLVEAADFALPAHAATFQAIADMVRQGVRATPHNLASVLDAGLFAELGGAVDYLARLWANSSSLHHIADHARVIHALAVRRRIVAACEEVRAIAATPDVDALLAEDFTATAVTTLETAAGRLAGSTARTMTVLVDDALAAIDARRAGTSAGLPLPWIDLQAVLGGLRRKRLYIMAGRPGMGKSAVAIELARRLGMNAARILLISLEMADEEIAGRMIGADAAVVYQKIDTGSIDDAEAEAIVASGQRMRRLPVEIRDNAPQTMAQIGAAVRRAAARAPVDLVIVDYLQLVSAGRRKGEASRYEIVTETSNALKLLAKAEDVPVLALAQLSRKVDERDDKHPILSDLRESGAIEQDADAILFLYREEYYAEREARDGADPSALDRLDACRHVLEIDVAKNRGGPTRRVKVWFDAPTNRVENWGGVN